MQKISSATLASSQPLYSVAATRQIEQHAAAGLPPHTLMQRAGLRIARLSLALAPHAQRIWIACGPGNNGGDGFEAAMHLQQWGKTVVVTWTGLSAGKTTLPPDALASRERALAAGVAMAEQPPQDFDFCIDALLGIGATLNTGRAGSARMTQWLELMQVSGMPRLAVDVPTGLNADTGQSTFSGATKSIAGGARSSAAARIFTLSLLTLKPGLFMAQGRDCAGEVWFDDLGIDSSALPTVMPAAWLTGHDRITLPLRATAAHASHKGSFGDVAVLGGESTPASHMAGAALLAARAALHAGAGRVYVALLGKPGATNSLTVDPTQPELMFRSPEALDLKSQVVVCGCGGGEAVKTVLAKVLSVAPRLVLDADALNAIAIDTQLQTLLKARHARSHATVLTPHPLEAARLAGLGTAEVQANRLKVAEALAAQYQAVVILKGSGTVIAAPGETSYINASGNALLATAGTGDVLAGMVGASLGSGMGAFEAACSAVFAHGRLADDWLAKRSGQALVASDLARGAIGRP
ncbi:NAD(P)H-hydrate dehydratase [Polaromonas sp.]|uniref:NAD(P)H-hydrate dehydratase n=1 Tax=Polaromonas sp. TaxID=1869339 RepID=UPI003BAAFD1B